MENKGARSGVAQFTHNTMRIVVGFLFWLHGLARSSSECSGREEPVELISRLGAAGLPVVPAFVCLIPAALLILRGARDANAWRLHLHPGFWYGTVTQGALLYWAGGGVVGVWAQHNQSMSPRQVRPAQGPHTRHAQTKGDPNGLPFFHAYDPRK